jgi:hypothetical protein
MRAHASTIARGNTFAEVEGTGIGFHSLIAIVPGTVQLPQEFAADNLFHFTSRLCGNSSAYAQKIKKCGGA